MSKTKVLYFFDVFVLLGFLGGSSMAYLLKGLAIWSIKNGSQLDHREDYNYFSNIFAESVIKIYA